MELIPGTILSGEVGVFILRRGWQKGIHNWVADMVGAGATVFIALCQDTTQAKLAKELCKLAEHIGKSAKVQGLQNW